MYTFRRSAVLTNSFVVSFICDECGSSYVTSASTKYKLIPWLRTLYKYGIRYRKGFYGEIDMVEMYYAKAYYNDDTINKSRQVSDIREYCGGCINYFLNKRLEESND